MRAIGIILAGGNNHRMRELSQKRAIAAMPIAYAPQFTKKYNAANAAELGVTIPADYQPIE